MAAQTQRTLLLSVISVIVSLGAMLLLLIGAFALLNEQLRGTWTDTRHAEMGPGDGPLVRLVLHRLIAEENAVEVSAVLVLSHEVRSAHGGEVVFVATINDGTSIDHFRVTHLVRLDTSSAEPGATEAAVQSQVFKLPAWTGFYGFPFDDYTIRPAISVRKENVGYLHFDTEIHKSLAGRVLEVEQTGGLFNITLRRTWVERLMVITGSLVFLSVSLLIVSRLLETTLTGLEELIAVAGYLVAAAGARDILGFSRTPAISVAELVVIGLPLVLLTLGIANSVFGGRHRPKSGNPG